MSRGVITVVGLVSRAIRWDIQRDVAIAVRGHRGGVSVVIDRRKVAQRRIAHAYVAGIKSGDIFSELKGHIERTVGVGWRIENADIRSGVVEHNAGLSCSNITVTSIVGADIGRHVDGDIAIPVGSDGGRVGIAIDSREVAQGRIRQSDVGGIKASDVFAEFEGYREGAISSSRFTLNIDARSGIIEYDVCLCCGQVAIARAVLS